jgi:hypothetical protein
VRTASPSAKPHTRAQPDEQLLNRFSGVQTVVDDIRAVFDREGFKALLVLLLVFPVCVYSAYNCERIPANPAFLDELNIVLTCGSVYVSAYSNVTLLLLSPHPSR